MNSIFNNFAKTLILLGFLFIISGLIINYIPKINIAKLPGDIFYKKGNFSFYFPFTTSIIISIILTLIVNFLSKK